MVLLVCGGGGGDVVKDNGDKVEIDCNLFFFIYMLYFLIMILLKDVIVFDGIGG